MFKICSRTEITFKFLTTDSALYRHNDVRLLQNRIRSSHWSGTRPCRQYTSIQRAKTCEECCQASSLCPLFSSLFGSFSSIIWWCMSLFPPKYFWNSPYSKTLTHCGCKDGVNKAFLTPELKSRTRKRRKDGDQIPTSFSLESLLIPQDDAFRSVIDEIHLQHDQLTSVFKCVWLFFIFQWTLYVWADWHALDHLDGFKGAFLFVSRNLHER